jgi:putative transposase
MARQPRLVLPGVAMHVIQRGHNRNACFRAPGDQALYLAFLRELAPKSDCLVHAYCLMPNHVHLLMTPSSEGACAALMRNLGQRYVRHFNRRYNRSGTLWEGRFRSCVIDSARYLLACYRYIELNPVRAGLAAYPQGYESSSYSANMGKRADTLITPHVEFLALGNDGDARIRAYAGLFEEVLQPSVIGAIRKATNAGGRLGSEQML